VEGAELFKRDIPNAELHLLDTGHFALEEEGDRIGSLIHEFLDRTINNLRPQRGEGRNEVKGWTSLSAEAWGYA
jgi:hypothetical protein